MTIRNGKTLLATLFSTGIITLSMSSAMAADCARMEDKSVSNYRSSAGYHHAIFYNSGQPSTRAGFIKTAHHEAKPLVDIVDTAISAGSFNTLVAAIKAAGLVDTLKGKGPFTVFAPTDEAFAKVPKKDLNALLEDKEALTRVLTYHVVPGKVMAADVVKLKSADTVEGHSVSIDASPSGVKVNNANVVKTDVVTANGVIHVIDTVLMPN